MGFTSVRVDQESPPQEEGKVQGKATHGLDVREHSLAVFCSEALGRLFKSQFENTVHIASQHAVQRVHVYCDPKDSGLFNLTHRVQRENELERKEASFSPPRPRLGLLRQDRQQAKVRTILPRNIVGALKRSISECSGVDGLITVVPLDAACTLFYPPGINVLSTVAWREDVEHPGNEAHT